MITSPENRPLYDKATWMDINIAGDKVCTCESQQKQQGKQ